MVVWESKQAAKKKKKGAEEMKGALFESEERKGKERKGAGRRLLTNQMDPIVARDLSDRSARRCCGKGASLSRERVECNISAHTTIHHIPPVMDPTPENIAALSNYLAQSLDPRTRRAAEASLAQAERQPGFPLLLLALVQNEATEGGYPVRLAAALFFKNLCRRGWQEVRACTIVAQALCSQADPTKIRRRLIHAG